MFVDCGHGAIWKSYDNLRSGKSKGCPKCPRLGYDFPQSVYRVLEKRWTAIKQRCNNPNDGSFERYGGRGIKISPEFENDCLAFCRYVMDLPGYDLELTLDRIDNDGNYAQGNLRWLSLSKQQSNKRTNWKVEYHGESLSLKEFVIKYTSISYNYALICLRSGTPVERLVDIPPGQKRGKAARIRFDELRAEKSIHAGE